MINSSLTVTQAEAAGKLKAGRSMHLVDVENLVGGTSFREADVAATAAAYAEIAPVRAADLVVVSSSHRTALATWFGWGSARRVVGSGLNGADLALIEIIETENLAVRFDRVVIASGDRIFATPAAQLQSRGVAVTVVSRRGALSRAVRLAVRDVRYLDLLPELGPATAARRVA